MPVLVDPTASTGPEGSVVNVQQHVPHVFLRSRVAKLHTPGTGEHIPALLPLGMFVFKGWHVVHNCSGQVTMSDSLTREVWWGV